MYPCVFTDEIGQDIEEAVRLCAQEEVRAIQIRVVEGHNVVYASDEDIRRMVDVARRYGVRVAGIGSPFGKCAMTGEEYAEHLRLFERVVEVAHRFETTMVRVFAFWPPDPAIPADRMDDWDAYLPGIAEQLRAPAARARQEGLLLVLENEYTTMAGTCAQARQVIDAVDSPALRVCWDVASGWYTGEPIFPDGYGYVRGLVSDVHVRDATADPADRARHGEVARLGDGAIVWAEVLGRLKAEGYSGPLTLETHLYQDDPLGATKLREATAHGMRELRRLLAAS
jgi:sugar phosphate isomerase/epimerase